MSDRRIDSVGFFHGLASEMNAHPEVYDVFGDASLDLVVLMRDEGREFRVRLVFDGISCDGVAEAGDGDERTADCWLEGDLAAWQAMFDDIVAHGRATGRQTINSLTLVGDAITVQGDDPLGVDVFFRCNQTVQAFLDGAAAVLRAPADA